MGSDIKVDNKGEVCKSIERGRYRDNKEVNSIDTRVVYNKEKRVGEIEKEIGKGIVINMGINE